MIGWRFPGLWWGNENPPFRLETSTEVPISGGVPFTKAAPNTALPGCAQPCLHFPNPDSVTQDTQLHRGHWWKEGEIIQPTAVCHLVQCPIASIKNCHRTNVSSYFPILFRCMCENGLTDMDAQFCFVS